MDTARYYVALFIVAVSPGVFLFWFSIHPFIAFWRKVGYWQTLAIHYTFVVMLAGGVVLLRRAILSIEFGTNSILMALAVLIFAIVIALRIQLSKQLSTTVMIGLPELAPKKYESRLLTEGIYARIRHPRYTQLLLAFLAYALFSNYLAAYIVFLLSLVWVLLLVRVEEQELRERFGKEYERYCERVPRLIPKF